MLRIIFLYGALAGLIVILPLASVLVWEPSPEATTSSHVFGYTLMVVALSMIFLGVKRYRDRELGGVIKFLPAFLLGLGISAVAGVIYVIGWEISLHLTDFGFVSTYADGMVAKARAGGKTAAEIEKMVAEMDAFRVQYMNPLFRLPITFVEIFPVGVVISLATAAALRNPRVLPARAA
jgi:hypothetical protein